MDIVRVRRHPPAVLRGSTVGQGGFEAVEGVGHEGLRCGAMRSLGSPGLTSPGSAPVRPLRTRFLAERALQGGTAAKAGDKRFQNADCRLQISDCPSTPGLISVSHNLQSEI